MNTSRNVKVLRIFAVLIIVALLLVGGAALAQNSLPATEGGVRMEGAANSDSQADGLFSPSPDQTGEPAATDGEAPQPAGDQKQPDYLDGQAPDDNPTSLNRGSAAAATFSYYQVAGATLRGRTSTATTAYDGTGCIHLTAGAGIGLIVNTELLLPKDAVIKYLRVYYKDTNNPGSVRGYITRYAPGTATNDLVYAASGAAFTGGYGFTVSNEITETVNNTAYAYTLIGWPTSPSSALQICGLRVAYYAPFQGATFLPTIER